MSMDPLGDNHFLSQPRPDALVGPPAGVVDTTTVAAHDFDVDTRTGFMPAQQPLLRLPSEWEAWEDVLDVAIHTKLQLGSKEGLDESEKDKSESWRAQVRQLPILPTTDLKKSEVVLRRAHLVLSWLMHFYIHTLPPSAPIRIPAPITVPLLQVSNYLQLPPVVTYSDDVLYNWKFKDGNTTDEHGNDRLPTVSNIDCITLFTGTTDEAEFYLTSARMELTGVDALELMRTMMDEMFVGDEIATRRITEYLTELAGIIDQLGDMLLSVKEGVRPQVFYDDIRPWFKGEDSTSGHIWEFEGMELDPTLKKPTELSGASAGQSALVHSLDVFLGVDRYSHSQMTVSGRAAFLKRMQLYMPRHHRAFLDHLSQTPHQLRDYVLAKDDEKLTAAYNAAVQALKVFRDKHMIVVALYIIGPARKAASVPPSNILKEEVAPSPSDLEVTPPPGATAEEVKEEKEALKGTGGTDLVKFLKGVRDQTKGALLGEA